MSQESDVLVVGAGPVGLLAGLRLRLRGLPVRIIDQQLGTVGHTFACALHPSSLKLLDELGLAAEAMHSGRSLHSLAFYEGPARKAEVHFTDLPVEFPFVLVLPQSALEQLLERELASQGAQVRWNHRLAELRQEPDAVAVTIEKLVEPMQGYLQPDGARAVQDRRQERFPYVVGADGQDSFVRESLRIDCESFGEGEAFVVYEFDTDVELPHEVRVVLEERTVNVMWPLSDHRCRWSFQLSPSEVLGETKGGRPLLGKPAEMEKALAHHAQKLLAERAPWFEGPVQEIEWWIGSYFERRLAARFGEGRCWLAGDAAHRTSPIGVHSLNLGLIEAIDLADTIAQVLQKGGMPELLQGYEVRHRRTWARLLKAGAVLQAAPVSSWAASHRERILPCLPVSGQELESSLNQLGLHLL